MNRPARVLAVDDEEGVRNLVERYVEREFDCEVVTAPDPETALELLDEDDGFECVVSDYEMPGMDGLAFYEAVQERAPDLPFVLFTGRGDESVASAALSAGVTDYVRKGSGDGFGLLAERVERAVEGYRREREAAALERINDVIREIHRELVDAETRFEVARAVCETLADSEPYRLATMGEFEPDGAPTVYHLAGDAVGYLQELMADSEPTEIRQGPAYRAFEQGEPQVIQRFDEHADLTQWQELAAEYDIRSAAAFPLSHEGEVHGVLLVHAARPAAFDDRERNVLGELAGTVGRALGDIASREALAERELELARYRAVLDALGEPVYVLDGDDRFRFVNEAFLDATGYGREAVIGERHDIVVADEQTERVDRETERLRDASDGDAVAVSFDLLTADGERRRCEGNLTALATDASGGNAVAGVLHDIEAHERLRARLAEATRTITRLHDTARELKRAETESAVHELVVEAAEEVLDFDLCVSNRATDGELRVAAASDDLPPDAPTTLPTDEGIVGEVYRTGDPAVHDDVRTADTAADQDRYRSALTVPMGDHGVFQAVATGTGAFDEREGEFAQLLAQHATAALDRIDRERALRERERRLERENERLEAFASILSHDLRNPLNVAKGRLELAREATDDPAVADQQADVAVALDRMEELVEDVLALLRDGSVVDETESVDVGAVARDAWTTVEDEGASLVVAESAPTVEADPERLRAAFENLYRNSIQHGAAGNPEEESGTTADAEVAELPDDPWREGPAGGSPSDGNRPGDGAITVRVGALDGQGFYVADDGEGVPPEHRDEVFDHGFTTADDGTGFGLAIVADIAEAHGWSVDLTESEAGGARFEFRTE